MQSDMPIGLLVSREWNGTKWHYPNIERMVEENKRLRAELDAAIKHCDEARRDAERYRWLKSDGCYWVHIQSRPHGDLVFQGRYGRAFYHHQGTAEMDDVIDSCIAAQRKGVA